MVEPQEAKIKQLTLKDLRNLEIAIKSSIFTSDQYIQSGENEHAIVLSELKITMDRLKNAIGEDLFKEVIGFQHNARQSKTIECDLLISLQEEIKKIQRIFLAKSFNMEDINRLSSKQSQSLSLASDIQQLNQNYPNYNIESSLSFLDSFHSNHGQKLSQIKQEEGKNDNQVLLLNQMDVVEQNKMQDKVDGDWKFQQLTLSLTHSNSRFPIQKPVDCKFEGETLNGIPNGYGSLTYVHEKEPSNIYSFTQFGNFKDGLLHGPSYRINGDRYTNFSTYYNGIRNGIVKVYTSLGVLCYIGYYNDGKRNGYGKRFYVNGNQFYEGNFRNNMHYGKGKVYYKDSIFEGEWLNDLKVSGILQLYDNGKKFKVEYNYELDQKNGYAHQFQKAIKEEPLLD